MLTSRQADALDFVKRFQAFNRGVSPSTREIAEGIGLASTSGVHRLLSALEERQFITRIPNRARAIKVLQQPMGDER